MNVKEFESNIDNRELYGVNSKKAYEAAYKWAEESNINSENDCEWSWVCGFKLDYDGSIISINCRFYPPHKSHVDFGKWHGYFSVYLFEKELLREEIVSETLNKLKEIVEVKTKGLETKIKNKILEIFK